MNHYYNCHYITTDSQNYITSGWSDGPHPEKNTTDATCINAEGGYQFRLFPGGEENPPLYTTDGIPLYKYVDGEVMARTEAEVASDRAAIPEPPPSLAERMEAQVTYTAMMTDTLLEV